MIFMLMLPLEIKILGYCKYTTDVCALYLIKMCQIFTTKHEPKVISLFKLNIKKVLFKI